MTSTKVIIFGKSWTIRALPKKKFKTIHGRCLGITVFNKRRIDLKNSALRLDIIRHELTHAYIHYCCIANTEMGQEQMEEFMCDFIGEYAGIIHKKAKKVLTALKDGAIIK